MTLVKEFSISNRKLFTRNIKRKGIHEVLEFISKESIDAWIEEYKNTDVPLKFSFVSGARMDEINL